MKKKKLHENDLGSHVVEEKLQTFQNNKIKISVGYFYCKNCTRSALISNKKSFWEKKEVYKIKTLTSLLKYINIKST